MGIQIHTKRQELESTLTTLQTSIEKETVAKGTKRSLEEMKGKKDPTLANVIVPPSFLQTIWQGFERGA